MITQLYAAGLCLENALERRSHFRLDYSASPSGGYSLQTIDLAMSTQFYLITYDLADTKAANKGRTRLHKMLLSGYGKWTHYSVFECFLTTVQFAKLQIQLEKLVEPHEDSVRVYVRMREQ